MEKDAVGSGVKQLSRHAMEVENSLFSGCEKGPQMHHLVVLGIAGEPSCGVFGAGGVRGGGVVIICRGRGGGCVVIRCRGVGGGGVVIRYRGVGRGCVVIGCRGRGGGCVVIGCRGRGERVCGYWVQGCGGGGVVIGCRGRGGRVMHKYIILWHFSYILHVLR